jgi:hypothetical protein
MEEAVGVGLLGVQSAQQSGAAVQGGGQKAEKGIRHGEQHYSRPLGPAAKLIK